MLHDLSYEVKIIVWLCLKLLIKRLVSRGTCVQYFLLDLGTVFKESIDECYAFRFCVFMLSNKKLCKLILLLGLVSLESISEAPFEPSAQTYSGVGFHHFKAA